MAIASTLTVEAHVRVGDSDAPRTLLPRTTLTRARPAELGSAALRLRLQYVDILANSPTGANQLDDCIVSAELESAEATDARIAVRSYSGGTFFVLDVKRGAVTRLASVGCGNSASGGSFGQNAKRILLLSGGPVALRWSASSVP